jgi:hypothetical protein
MNILKKFKMYFKGKEIWKAKMSEPLKVNIVKNIDSSKYFSEIPNLDISEWFEKYYKLAIYNYLKSENCLENFETILNKRKECLNHILNNTPNIFNEKTIIHIYCLKIDYNRYLDEQLTYFTPFVRI